MFTRKVFQFLLLELSVFCVYATKEKPSQTVYIPGVGNVVGRTKVDSDKNEYHIYHDIPYAHVNPNQLFQPATEPEEMKNGFVNDGILPICPGFEVEYWEDVTKCLVLKIHTKNITAKNPVFVVLLGYKPTPGQAFVKFVPEILSKDIVMVSFEFRVGPYGFLSTGTEEIPGNIAMLDVIAALKWIQNYISYFGGDPDRVTVMGQYNGAEIAGMLAYTPLAEGLFHQLIIHSGSPSMEQKRTVDPVRAAEEVGVKVGCKDNDKDSLSKCLIATPPHTLVEAYKTVWENHKGHLKLFTDSGLSNEGWTAPRAYPTIGGFVDHPTLHLSEEYSKQLQSRFAKKIIKEKYHNEIDELKTIVMNEIKDYTVKFLELFDGELEIEPDSMRAEVLNSTSEKISYYLINSIFKSALENSEVELKETILKDLASNKRNHGRSYAFLFNYPGGRHYFKIKGDSVFRDNAELGDEYQYLFVNDYYEGDDKLVSALMIDFWTSFVATGIPKSGQIEWPEMQDVEGPYLLINRPPSIVTGSYNILGNSFKCKDEKYGKLLEFFNNPI